MLSEQDQLYLAELSERRQRVQEEQIQAYREDIADWISGFNTIPRIHSDNLFYL